MKIRIIKFILFISLVVIFFVGYNKIFRIKLDEADSMKIFYEQKENTIDVLALGSSHVFGSINPAILYRDYGIACYDLCGAGLPTKVSYYYLIEAIKTQTPKVIILGIEDTSLDGSNDIGTEYSYLWTGNMKWSLNKLNLVKDIANDNWIDVFLGYPVTHGRYDGDLAERDFLPYRGDIYHKYYKGNRVFWGVNEEAFNASDYPYTSEVGDFSGDTKQWIDGVLDIANDISADVILYASPALKDKSVQMSINAISEYAKARGVKFIDLRKEQALINIDYENEMNDKEHVNYLGQEKTSQYIGKFLKENFNLPDRRKDNNYVSWELCLEDYETAFNARILTLHTGNLEEYLKLLLNKDYTILVKFKGENFDKKLLSEREGFAELGITLKQNCDNEMYLVCNGVPQDCDLGEYRELGNHSIIINEDNLQYDLNIIGFPDNRITFIIFDNKQKSIVEYRYFFYDNISEEWILEREDYGMQAIWNKR